MRKLIDYFWAFVRKGDLKPYEHGPANKFVITQERDEYGRFIEKEEHPINLIATNGCGDDCNCKCES
jgi:hypothetical protein